MRASKPLSHQGTLIENITCTFEAGKIVSATATAGEDVLNRLISTDDGARRLGEVALVPHSSPIAQSGVLFWNTLFDENAASHIALGQAYATCLIGGEKMQQEELTALGANSSLIHVDWMIGSGAMDVDGVAADGTAEPLMVALVPGSIAATLRETTQAREAERTSNAASHPLVQKVLDRFKGARIVDVRRPEAPSRRMRRSPLWARSTMKLLTPIPASTRSMTFEKETAPWISWGMMKKAQAVQAKLQEAQEELGRVEVEGQSGGGMVSLTLTAKGELKGVRIDASLLTPADKEMLEDLIIAAFTDGKAKADRVAAEKMQSLTEGLPLPPGMKLPF